jgi:hypothetical protein
MSRIFTAAGAVALLLLSASPGFSGSSRTVVLPEKVDMLILPAASALTFKAFKPGGAVAAQFTGSVIVSGTYYYGDVFESGSSDDPALFIVPDRTTMARLPRFKREDAPSLISLANAAAFAKGVLSPAVIAALKNGKTEFVTGKISVHADQFEAGVACHDPYISARFVSVEGAAAPFKAAALDQPDC